MDNLFDFVAPIKIYLYLPELELYLLRITCILGWNNQIFIYVEDINDLGLEIPFIIVLNLNNRSIVWKNHINSL